MPDQMLSIGEHQQMVIRFLMGACRERPGQVCKPEFAAPLASSPDPAFDWVVRMNE
jgi:hypothetical protein